MKIAIVGSRTVTEIGLDGVIPKECTEIVSGGAKGIDTLAKEIAEKNGIKSESFLECYFKNRLLYKKRLRKDEYRPIQGIIVKNSQKIESFDKENAFKLLCFQGKNVIIE